MKPPQGRMAAGVPSEALDQLARGVDAPSCLPARLGPASPACPCRWAPHSCPRRWLETSSSSDLAVPWGPTSSPQCVLGLCRRPCPAPQHRGLCPRTREGPRGKGGEGEREGGRGGEGRGKKKRKWEGVRDGGGWGKEGEGQGSGAGKGGGERAEQAAASAGLSSTTQPRGRQTRTPRLSRTTPVPHHSAPRPSDPGEPRKLPDPHPSPLSS